MLNFKIAKLMASIFTPEFHIGNILSIANSIQGISEDKFNGEFISFPIPQEAPPEIPRIILNTKDRTWKLELSLQRTNLIFLKPINLSVDVPDVGEFSEFACRFFGAYKNNENIKIQKLGFVTERYLEFDNDSPAQFIVNKFCKEELSKNLFDNTNSFEIHSLKKYKFKNFNINSWIRFKSAKLANQAKTPILLIENDINTFEEKDKDLNFDGDDTIRFFDMIPKHLEKIFNLFLGEAGE